MPYGVLLTSKYIRTNFRRMWYGSTETLTLPILTWKIFISVLAAGLLIGSQVTYVRHIWQRKIQPVFLSWLGWGMLMLATAFVQGLDEGFATEQLTLFMSGGTCIFIGLFARWHQQFSRQRFDVHYLFFGGVCFVLYLLFDEVWIATIFALVADLFMGIPTLMSAWKTPENEKSSSWYFAGISWMLSVIVCLDGPLIFMSFPLYLFVWCSVILIFTYRRV